MNRNIVIVVAIILGLLLVIGLSLRSEAPLKVETKKIVALSTFTILNDMVIEVGGDRVEAISLTKPGAEIHGYETTPGDLVQASRADIFFENGLNLELWADKLRSSLPDMPSVIVSEGVEVMQISKEVMKANQTRTLGCRPSKGLFTSKIFETD